MSHPRFALLALAVIGCVGPEKARAARTGSGPDAIPVMLNREPPFRYPTELYDRKVQGNVMLHLLLDSTGSVVTESTRVTASSGYPGLDSAALSGSRDLRFNPAMAHGVPISVTVLFPVLVRHPDALPLPGDSILHGKGETGAGKR